MTMEKGSAPIIITDLNASIPPAKSSVPINDAKITPQTIICLTSLRSLLPPEAKVFIINIPESAEVIRKVRSKITMITDKVAAKPSDVIKFTVANN